MNRAQRRHAKPQAQLEGFRFLLTPDEAKIVEEALYGYCASLDEEWANRSDMPPLTAWARQRAEKLRQAMEAALDGRPHVDPNPQRHAPQLQTG